MTGATGRSEILFTRALAAFLTILAVALAVWGVWTLGASCFTWLKDGTWSHPSIRDVLSTVRLHDLGFQWIGIDRLFQWLLGLPGSAGLLVAAWATGTWAMAVTDTLPVGAP